MKSRKRDNIVRIADINNTEKYEHFILKKMHPEIYNEYGCIKIQVISGKLEFAEVIIRRFRWAGLKEEERKKKAIKVNPSDGEGYILPDAWEITLKKIPVLEMMQDD